MLLSMISIEEGMLTLIIGAVGSYFGLKVLVVELKIKFNNLATEQASIKQDLKEVESRMRLEEQKSAVSTSQIKGIYTEIAKVSAKFDEAKKR